MRQRFELTHDEMLSFQRLRPFQGAALTFWRRIAAARGLDPKTIMSTAPKFSGLPLGHNLPWCHPIPIKCNKRPVI